MRLITSLFAASVLVAAPLSSLAQAVYPQVSLSIVEQTVSIDLCLNTSSGNGTTEVSVPFNEACGDLVVSGTATSSNVGGTIIISVDGAASNTGGGTATIPVEVHGGVSFTVPHNSFSGVNLPTTTLVQTLTSTPVGGGVRPRAQWSFTQPKPPHWFAATSTLLGGELIWQRDDFLWTDLNPYGTPPGGDSNRGTFFFDWPGGDEVKMPFSMRFDVLIDPSTTISLDEDVTYELRYIPLPEPTSSLTIPADIGLLAALAHLRGVPLVP